VGADESAVISINLRKAQRDRPFAAAQGDKGTHTVVLRAAKHLEAQAEGPFAAAQGDKKGPFSPSGT